MINDSSTLDVTYHVARQVPVMLAVHRKFKTARFSPTRKGARGLPWRARAYPVARFQIPSKNHTAIKAALTRTHCRAHGHISTPGVGHSSNDTRHRGPIGRILLSGCRPLP